MSTRKLPLGIQSFEDLRRNHYLYVDKTEYIWKLIKNGKVYFLSRPRRFGKSLLISTLEAYFQGKKELFQGLAIEELENARDEEAWQEYPVIRFSLSGGDYNQENGLSRTLLRVLTYSAERYGCGLLDSDLPNQFAQLILDLYRETGKQVVILVDEYDKPLLETMEINPEQEEKNRLLYKGFFSVLKDEDQYLKFVFFTGVTRFSKISIFSDLNQLDDISLNDEYSGICGITEEEINLNFKPEISALAEKESITEEECKKELAKMYDGYHFSADGEGMYNPFSLLKAFRDRKISFYWFSTATPTFLIRKLRGSGCMLEDLATGVEEEEIDLTDYLAENPDPVPLFYQTGYLTISGYDRRFRTYFLKFPNDEVRYGFMKSLAPYLFGGRERENAVPLRHMVLDLESGDAASFMNRLQALFAGVPYPEGTGIDYEREWRNQIYLILALLGQNVKCEVHSAQGRADCIVETKDYVYVFEFKVDDTADAALQQIEDMRYAKPYRTDLRRVLKIGVSFSSEKRNIEEWKAKECRTSVE